MPSRPVWQNHTFCFYASYRFSDRQEALGVIHTFELVCGASESHQEVYFYSYSSAHMLFLVWYQEYSLQECLGNTMTLLRLRSKELSMGIRPSALREGQSLPLSSRALHQFCGCLKLWPDISLENHLNKDPGVSRTLITFAAQTLENRSPDLTARSTGPGFLTSLKTW